jgi:hypothetical protein
MVKNDGGQLYTIEGFAAGLIMVMTAYLVVNATSVYTAGDTHINDMQLEALGSDVLKMMDVTPNSTDSISPLQEIITYTTPYAENATFNTIFRDYTDRIGAGPNHDIQFIANFTCRNTDNTTSIYPLASIPSRPLSGGEHTVKATKWVIVNKDVCGNAAQNRAVLVEVLLWRD